MITRVFVRSIVATIMVGPFAFSGPVDGGLQAERAVLQARAGLAPPSAIFPVMAPPLPFVSSLSHQLLANVTNWFSSLRKPSERGFSLSDLSFKSRSSAMVPTAMREPATVAVSSTGTRSDDSNYRWLLRSQRRNVLRSERGRRYNGGLFDPRRSLASRSTGDVRTQVSLYTTHSGEVAGNDSGLPTSYTEVKVDFPVLSSSQTSLRGRIGGDSGYFTWTAEANVAFYEVQDHSMNTGLQVGSMLYQDALQMHERHEDVFLPQWVARVYARDDWKLDDHIGVSYGLTYQRTNFPTEAGFFNPNVAFIADLGGGFKLDNQFAYGVNLPGKVSLFGYTTLPESYPLSEDAPLQPERFVAYRASLEKQIGSRQAIEIGYMVERVANPLLQVPFRDATVRPEPFAYQLLLTNSTPMRSNSVRVGYRAQVYRSLSGGFTYRFGRAKAFGESPGPGLGDLGLQTYLSGVDDRLVHTISASLVYSVPSTFTTLSGSYRWDSEISLRPDYMSDTYDDPTTQLDIRLRQGIPLLSNSTTTWEFLLDVKNPFTFGSAPFIVLGHEERMIVLVPHPRRITGGLTLSF